jgi:hypothetical protein
MMNRNLTILSSFHPLLLIFVLLVSPAAAQTDDPVLVDGEPPLTQLMAGKVIVLLDWALELKLSNQQQVRIKEALIDVWKARNQSEMRGALDIIEVYEKVFRMSEAERNQARGALGQTLLKSIQAHPNDPLARILLSAKGLGGPARAEVVTSSPPGRVGGDGFTGIYRMVRPRAININSSVANSGVWIEYITFLPGGNVYWSLPPEGLLHFDAPLTARWDPDDWGTYTIASNGDIHVLRGPSKKLYVITRTGDRLNNPPSLGKGTFRRVPTADGLRLEGNYRRTENEPTITFSADGKFRDGGVFRYFGTLVRPDGSHYQDDGAPGSGTYSIGQNTLELRYSDGRIKRHPFIVFPENLAKKPAVDSFILRREERFTRY